MRRAQCLVDGVRVVYLLEGEGGEVYWSRSLWSLFASLARLYMVKPCRVEVEGLDSRRTGTLMIVVGLVLAKSERMSH